MNIRTYNQERIDELLEMDQDRGRRDVRHIVWICIGADRGACCAIGE